MTINLECTDFLQFQVSAVEYLDQSMFVFIAFLSFSLCSSYNLTSNLIATKNNTNFICFSNSGKLEENARSRR